MSGTENQKDQQVIKLTPGIWIMIAILGILCLVPFAAMTMALLKSGYFPQRQSRESQAQTTAGSGSGTGHQTNLDLSGLRSSAERAAERNLPIPTLAEPDFSRDTLQVTNPGMPR